MRVTRIIAILLIAVSLILTACASPTESTTTQTQSPPQFTKITAPLTRNGTKPGTDIPRGSVVYHWANGITEVYGPTDKLIFVAKDSEAAMLPHPSGPSGPFESPATHMFQVPSGTSSNEEAVGTDNVTQMYLGNTLILTIIEKSESYKY